MVSRNIVFLLILAQINSEQHKYVSYIDFPTCGEAVDADCLSVLGVPGYSNHNYNVLNFAFYVSKYDKLYDASLVWGTPSHYFSQLFRDQIAEKTNASDREFRQAVKEQYRTKNIKILLSVFGATDNPIAAGLDAVALADRIANLTLTYNYDGVDINFFNKEYLFSGNGTGEQWLIALTQQLRDRLGWNYIITHAAIAPFFMGAPNYPYGGYLTIHQQVGSLINWYNILYYNQGANTWITYHSLFIHSTDWPVNTAVNEIICGSNSFGIAIPEHKIVIGKYIRDGIDGLSEWVSADNLKDYFLEYEWFNGFSTWQFAGDVEQNFSFSNTIIEALKTLNKTTYQERDCSTHSKTGITKYDILYIVIPLILFGILLLICMLIFHFRTNNYKRNKSEEHFMSDPMCALVSK